MHFTYIPKGVCSTRIDLEVEEGIIRHCEFTKGCAGNSAGVARLVTGRSAAEIIPLLKDVTCGGHTSCPAQLALALEACLREMDLSAQA